jgi:hypothetical protein
VPKSGERPVYRFTLDDLEELAGYQPCNGLIERRVNQQRINDQRINPTTDINPFCYNHLRVFGRFWVRGFLCWNVSTNGSL